MSYIDHGVGGDAEQCGSFCNLTNLIARLPAQLNAFQLRQGPKRSHSRIVIVEPYSSVSRCPSDREGGGGGGNNVRTDAALTSEALNRV